MKYNALIEKISSIDMYQESIHYILLRKGDRNTIFRDIKVSLNLSPFKLTKNNEKVNKWKNLSIYNFFPSKFYLKVTKRMMRETFFT